MLFVVVVVVVDKFVVDVVVCCGEQNKTKHLLLLKLSTHLRGLTYTEAPSWKHKGQ